MGKDKTGGERILTCQKLPRQRDINMLAVVPQVIGSREDANDILFLRVVSFLKLLLSLCVVVAAHIRSYYSLTRGPLAITSFTS